MSGIPSANVRFFTGGVDMEDGFYVFHDRLERLERAKTAARKIRRTVLL